MFYRVFGGLAFLLIGAVALGIITISNIIVAIICIVAGAALLAGK